MEFDIKSLSRSMEKSLNFAFGAYQIVLRFTKKYGISFLKFSRHHIFILRNSSEFVKVF